MKSPFENRWFCFIISGLTAYCLMTDWQDFHTINILNLVIFFLSTFLSLQNHQPNADKKIPIKGTSITNEFIETIDSKALNYDNNELKIHRLFHKKN